MRYDCIIIGSGPAGLSAAINLKIYHKNFLWFGNGALSDKVEKAEEVNNYPGLHGITGTELAERFRGHKDAMELTVTDQIVSAVYDMGDYYEVMAENQFYETKTIIMATGVVLSNLYEGEADYVGRGVSYCATCDGMLYRDKTIAVVSTSKRFEHEVEFLSGLAKQVYFFPLYKGYELPGEKERSEKQEVSEEKLSLKDKVQVLAGKPKKISGALRVNTLELADGTSLSADGIFIMRNAIAPTSLLAGLQLEEGHIGVNRKMETNLPGVYAAGDCTGKPYQYVKAVGEGNVAAHSVVEYLGEKK